MKIVNDKLELNEKKFNCKMVVMNNVVMSSSNKRIKKSKAFNEITVVSLILLKINLFLTQFFPYLKKEITHKLGT